MRDDPWSSPDAIVHDLRAIEREADATDFIYARVCCSRCDASTSKHVAQAFGWRQERVVVLGHDDPWRKRGWICEPCIRNLVDAISVHRDDWGDANIDQWDDPAFADHSFQGAHSVFAVFPAGTGANQAHVPGLLDGDLPGVAEVDVLAWATVATLLHF